VVSLKFVHMKPFLKSPSQWISFRNCIGGCPSPASSTRKPACSLWHEVGWQCSPFKKTWSRSWNPRTGGQHVLSILDIQWLQSPASRTLLKSPVQIFKFHELCNNMSGRELLYYANAISTCRKPHNIWLLCRLFMNWYCVVKVIWF
jgi:hypothetical protein